MKTPAQNVDHHSTAAWKTPMVVGAQTNYLCLQVVPMVMVASAKFAYKNYERVSLRIKVLNEAATPSSRDPA